MTQEIILGIDEVGRGPWAGPLVVGAVILKRPVDSIVDTTSLKISTDDPWQDLNDSKKLTAKRRTELDQTIRKYASAYAIGWVSATELDQYGLSAALKLATRRAVKQILAQKALFTSIIIDGTVNFLKNTPLEGRVSTLAKADGLIPEVSAASIIAKVARDAYMTKLTTKYPSYGFEKHVGYGTKLHRDSLEKYGICPEHRLSFRPVAKIAQAYPDRTFNSDASQNASNPQKTAFSPNLASKVTPRNPPNPARSLPKAPSTTSKGQHAEQCVAQYLESLGHLIIAQNFKTKTYEIDLISIKTDKIYFTEVKYRKNSRHSSALDQITSAKQRQMHYAAEKFISDRFQLVTPHISPLTPQNLQPLLAVASVSEPNYTIEDWFVLE